jgi:hypothetical protein
MEGQWLDVIKVDGNRFELVFLIRRPDKVGAFSIA